MRQNQTPKYYYITRRFFASRLQCDRGDLKSILLETPDTGWKGSIKHSAGDCLPFLLTHPDALEIRRIRCNATVLCCYCTAAGSATATSASGNLSPFNFTELMTTQIATNRCEGYNCTPPKECCKQGCCFFVTPPLYHPTSIQTNHLLAPLFLGHWYFWLAVTATVAGILCACSLWKKHSQDGGCCRSGSGDSRRRCSEPESNGSCYAPPQYSRCNSFHQPPPPYSEVASKPDLYPLVIAYHNPEPVVKSNNSTGFLMMQYFRNFIVRPVGNLSTTSTNDSLSSSFLCSAANEANLIIPPAYSNIASLEDLVTDSQPQPSPSGSDRRIPRSASSISSATTEYHQVLQHSPSAHTQLGIPTTPLSCHSGGSLSVGRLNTPSRSSQQSLVQIRDNPCFSATQGTTHRIATATIVTNNDVTTSHSVSFSENNKNEKLLQKPFHLSTNPLDQQVTCPALPPPTRKPIYVRPPKERSQDSTEDDDTQHNNFSDLLNLSLCQPQSDHPQVHSATAHLQDLHFSVTTSMTGSDISSLANLGTPDSPPRATSPTVEMRELLDKIQQLPQQKSPVPPAGVHSGTSQARNYFHKMRAKTLYMPLIEPEQQSGHAKTRVVPNVFSRVWLSRSAPCTPCGNFTPSFPTSKGSQKGSKSRITDGSPLLKQHAEESEDEPNKEQKLNKVEGLL